MARLIHDPGVGGISGKLGNFVYRLQKDGSVIVTKRPQINPNRVPTKAQIAHQQRFKEATAHYWLLMEDVSLKQAYEHILKARGSKIHLRAFVISDIMKVPKVQTIDLSNYRGAVGDTIYILAEDNVGVVRIRLTIHDTTNKLDLETAEKVFSEKITGMAEWVYTTTTSLPDENLNHQIVIKVTACDLAGNEAVSTVSVRP